MGDHEYDAQFRRGYAGPPVPAQTPPAPVDHVVGPPPSPAFTEHTVAPAAQPVPAEPDAVDQDADLTSRRVNPWAIALLVLSIAMMAVGVWILQQYASAYSNGYGIGDQTLAVIQQQLPPALLTAGIAGVIGFLVLGAVGAINSRARR